MCAVGLLTRHRLHQVYEGQGIHGEILQIPGSPERDQVGVAQDGPLHLHVVHDEAAVVVPAAGGSRAQQPVPGDGGQAWRESGRGLVTKGRLGNEGGPGDEGWLCLRQHIASQPG
jgi:hypothetical protein